MILRLLQASLLSLISQPHSVVMVDAKSRGMPVVAHGQLACNHALKLPSKVAATEFTKVMMAYDMQRRLWR